jgi:hypothetical protein
MKRHKLPPTGDSSWFTSGKSLARNVGKNEGAKYSLSEKISETICLFHPYQRVLKCLERGY